MEDGKIGKKASGLLFHENNNQEYVNMQIN